MSRSHVPITFATRPYLSPVCSLHGVASGPHTLLGGLTPEEFIETTERLQAALVLPAGQGPGTCQSGIHLSHPKWYRDRDTIRSEQRTSHARGTRVNGLVQ